MEDSEPGAKLGRPAPAPWKILLETERLTDESPGSAPNPPEDDRWKFGCWGRPTEFNSDIERACWEVKGGFWNPIELVRFKADEGCGSDE